MKTFTEKKEPTPKFIKDDLIQLYNASELEFVFVHAHCLKLGAKLQIDIGVQTIMAWYEDMLKLGWTKEVFLKRIEAVQRQEIFNRIGWDTWLRADTIMYEEHEMRRIVDSKVNMLIQRGQELKRLYEAGYALTDEEKKYVELAAYKEFEFQLMSARSQVLDEAKDILKRQLNEKLKAKQKRLLTLTQEHKEDIVNECKALGIFKDADSKIQFETYVKYINVFADLIPDNLIEHYTQTERKS